MAAAKHPPQFATAMHGLFYAMADAVLRYPRRDMISQYIDFSNPWRGATDATAGRFYFGSLDAYTHAVAAGLRELDWQSASEARQVHAKLAPAVPAAHSVEAVAWQALIGQVQSIYSRDDAAETFAKIRQHPHGELVRDFYRDNGALTYFSDREVQQRRRRVPSLAEMRTWQTGGSASSDQAFVISVDPNFFRIYAPMILHNAQQLPSVDFVILLCAPAAEAEQLHLDAEMYLSGLTALNRQDAPRNVRMIAVATPEWVGSERTFYACSRFLALPGLLEDYQSVYTIDADLFMLRDPRPFLQKTATLTLGVTRNDGPIGISPWRRYMAGNVVANRDYLDSPMLSRLHDYLSVGLAETASWMLDQNALAYAVEAVPGYRALTTPRPMTVGNFMGQWERNYRAATKDREVSSG